MAGILETWRQLEARQSQGENSHLTKQQRTRRRLLGFAVELFAENGYETTTASEIASAAGVSRATFFLHFPTKAALLGELSRQLGAVWSMETAPERETPLEAIRRLIEFLFRESSFDAVGSAVLIDFVETYGSDMTHGVGENTVHDHAVSLVKRAQAQGLLSRDWSADVLGHYIIANFNLLKEELNDLPADRAADKVFQLLLKGFAS